MLNAPEKPSNAPYGDPDLLALSPQQTNRFKQFRHAVGSCDSEEQRYQLCLVKRDELLSKRDSLNIIFAFYEQVFATSTTYQASKCTDTWRDFTATAIKGSEARRRRTNELNKASKHWGEDIVHHYAKEKGVSFAVQLAAVAKQHPNWKNDALPRLQQLANRRIELAGQRGRHAFAHPLERIDLVNAKAWIDDGTFTKMKDPLQVLLPLSLLRADQLPSGYGHDLHGLIVPKNGTEEGEDDNSETQCSGSDAVMGEAVPQKAAKTATDDPTTSATPNSSCSGIEEQTLLHGDIETADTASCNSVGIPDKVFQNSPPAAAAVNDTDQSISIHEGGVPIFESEIIDADQDTDSDPPELLFPSKVVLERSGAFTSNLPPRRSPRNLLIHTPQHVESRLKAPSASRRSQKTMEPGSKATMVSKPSLVDIEQLRTEAGNLSSILRRKSRISEKIPTVASKRQRASSLPPDMTRHEQAQKKKQAVCQAKDRDIDIAMTLGYEDQIRTIIDDEHNAAYVSQVIAELGQTIKHKPSTSRGYRTATCLLPILQHCKRPKTEDRNGAGQIYLLTEQDAKSLLDAETPDVPIVIERQQLFHEQPIAEFFEWIEDHDQMVSVQIPSRDVSECSFESRSLREVKERLLGHGDPEDPWNILDCGCPLPPSLPNFLTSWNCQLLARIRETVLNTGRAERTIANRVDWLEWKEIEHWALLSEGGHCTAPHTDSHGLATWITVQEGLFGFAWMSQPSKEQRLRWMSKPEHYDGQPWLYIILKAGQTIFFPSGTIHAVFRTRQAKTLALGGHILQWTGVGKWADTMKDQLQHPDITNEDVTDGLKWFSVVEGLVRKRLERSGITQ